MTGHTARPCHTDDKIGSDHDGILTTHCLTPNNQKYEKISDSRAGCRHRVPGPIRKGGKLRSSLHMISDQYIFYA